MANTLGAVQFLPLASAIAWWAIGIVPVARSRFFSPFERSLTSFAFLVGTWAFLDWTFFTFTEPSQVELAISISNVRITVTTAATFVLLLATKWISIGHSRRDAVLLLPVVVSIAIIWLGPLTFDTNATPSGLRLLRDPVLYAAWASQQVAYAGASIVLASRLFRGRRDLPARIQRRFFWTVGSLVVVLVLWLATDIFTNLTQTADVPWFSSFLIVPAAIILYFVVPLSTEDFSEMLRAVARIQERVTAVYLFYRSGEPLVALAASRNLPIEAEQLEGLLSVVGNFVETSVPGSRGYAVTAMRYDGLGIVAVRGEFVIGAAVYDGPAFDALRTELLRTLRNLEERHWRDLSSWEDATKVAEPAAAELSKFLHLPERAPSPTVRKGPPPDATPRESP